MLEHSVAVIEAWKLRQLRTMPNRLTLELFKDLYDDFVDFVRRNEAELENCQKDIATAAAIRSLTESEKSIILSDRMG
jgi:hypothetical protein